MSSSDHQSSFFMHRECPDADKDFLRKIPQPECPFNEGYYMRGEGSNYKDYQWMGEVTLTFAIHLMHHLGMRSGDKALDFGAARGFLVRALRMMHVDAFGYDISEWAVENCDENVKEFMSTTLNVQPKEYDFIISKDCWEHLSTKELEEIVPKLCSSTKKAILAIVPLTAYFGGKYLRPEDELDVTHKIRFSLHDWLVFLQPLAKDFTVSGAYHIKGCKAASEKVPQSCGFLTLTRI